MTLEHISASQINMFSRCQTQWFFRYGPRKLVIPPGIAAHVGSGVHGGAEASNRVALVTGQHEPESVVVDAAVTTYEQKLQREGVFFTDDEKPSAKRLMGEAKDTTATLAKLWRTDVAPTIQPVLVERRVELSVPDLEPTFVGFIDLYDQNQALRDLKTTAKSWTQEQADGDDQLTVYRQMVHALLGEYPKELAFDVLVKNKVPKTQHLTTVRDETDWLVMVERARLMVAQVQTGIFAPASSGSWVCSPKFCGYWTICPWQSKRKIVAMQAATKPRNEHAVEYAVVPKEV